MKRVNSVFLGILLAVFLTSAAWGQNGQQQGEGGSYSGWFSLFPFSFVPEDQGPPDQGPYAQDEFVRNYLGWFQHFPPNLPRSDAPDSWADEDAFDDWPTEGWTEGEYSGWWLPPNFQNSNDSSVDEVIQNEESIPEQNTNGGESASGGQQSNQGGGDTPQEPVSNSSTDGQQGDQIADAQEDPSGEESSEGYYEGTFTGCNPAVPDIVLRDGPGNIECQARINGSESGAITVDLGSNITMEAEIWNKADYDDVVTVFVSFGREGSSWGSFSVGPCNFLLGPGNGFSQSVTLPALAPGVWFLKVSVMSLRDAEKAYCEADFTVEIK
jgi:hypothetical protein